MIGLALGGLALLTALVPALPNPSDRTAWQRDLPLDRHPASRNADRQPLRPPAGHRPSVVPQRLLSGLQSRTSRRSAAFRGRSAGFPDSCSPPSGALRLTRPSAPRSAARSEPGPAAALARAVDPTRAVHRPLHRPRKPRLRRHRPQRPVRISRLSAREQHVVGQTTHPDVMGPPPHPAIKRLINIRAADASFVLDQLGRLTDSTHARRWPATSTYSTSGSSDTRSAAQPPCRSSPPTRGSKWRSTSTASSSAPKATPIWTGRCSRSNRRPPDHRIHARPRPAPEPSPRRRDPPDDPRKHPHGIHRRAVLPDGTRTLHNRPRNRHRLISLADMTSMTGDTISASSDPPSASTVGLGCPFTRRFAWTD